MAFSTCSLSYCSHVLLDTFSDIALSKHATWCCSPPIAFLCSAEASVAAADQYFCQDLHIRGQGATLMRDPIYCTGVRSPTSQQLPTAVEH